MKHDLPHREPIARHSWLLPDTDFRKITFHFPCYQLLGPDHCWDYDTREILMLVADDSDKSGRDGAVFRQICDRFLNDDHEEEDYVNWEAALAHIEDLDALEPTEPPQTSISTQPLQMESEGKIYVPRLFARPPRQTKIFIPSTEQTAACALEFETRYLLTLLAKDGNGSPEGQWLETLIEHFYPEVEPPEFQLLGTYENFRKREYIDYLSYLAEEGGMNDPTDPCAKLKVQREFTRTRNLLNVIGLFGQVEQHLPQEDDIAGTCEKLCSMILALPAGVLNIER